MNAHAETLRGMTYPRARRLLLGAGLSVLLLTSVLMYMRGVDTVEVAATLLFIPVFVAVLVWGLKGGLIAGALAAGAYFSLRYPAVQAVGTGRFVGLLLSRAAAFLVFGAMGGWAMRQLESSLRKLELFDHIDDDTGLRNARFLVEETDLELSRSTRYQTVFSVGVVDFPAAPLQRLRRRSRTQMLRSLGRTLDESIRTVDRAVHASDRERHRLAVMLPETGAEGARIFTRRLADRVGAFLRERGIEVRPDSVNQFSLTFPDDGRQALQNLREQFARIDAAEHPETST